MAGYDRETQFGDLQGAVKKAKKHRQGKASKGKIALAATAAIGMIGGGIALAVRDSGPELEYAAVQDRYMPGEMLVKFTQELSVTYGRDGNVITGLEEVDALNDALEGEVYEQLVSHPEELEVDMIYLVTVSKHADMEQLAEEFAAAEGVEWAIPNYIESLPYEEVEMDGSQLEQLTGREPNDPLYWSEGEYKRGLRDQWPLQNIDAAEAWEITTGIPEIRVAVIDTGADYNHEDLADNILRDENGKIIGYDFIHDDADPLDDHGHGTHVSGTIAAVTNNAIGMAGMNWEAKIMPIKVCTAGGGCPMDAILSGIVFAADNGAHVANMSLGGRRSYDIYDDAVRYADSKGTIIVAAAGNSNADTKNFAPANHPMVIAVAATDPNDKKAGFSNWGETVDVAAPGTPILSLRARGGYVMMQGTSMASPHTAGLVSMIIAANPELTGNREEVLRIVRAAVDPYDSKVYIGTGRINLAEAVRLAQEYDADAVPPHQERITYLAENLPEDGLHLLHYPYFQMGFMVTNDNRLGYAFERRGLRQAAGAGFIDNDLSDEGTIDELILLVKDNEGMRVCHLGEGEFKDVEGTINKDYQLATDAFYRALAGRNKLMKGIFGKKEFETLAENNCSDRWQPIDPDSGLDLQDLIDESLGE